MSFSPGDEILTVSPEGDITRIFTVACNQGNGWWLLQNDIDYFHARTLTIILPDCYSPEVITGFTIRVGKRDWRNGYTRSDYNYIGSCNEHIKNNPDCGLRYHIW
jgi:hypothetical protein